MNLRLENAFEHLLFYTTLTMILQDFKPHPSLNEFVQCYRIVHFDFMQAKEPILKAYAPRPEVCLHFFLRERELVQLGGGPTTDYHFPVVLAGQQTSVINRYLLGKDFMTFNIAFQPTALFRLFGIPSFELTGRYLDAEAIFSSHIRFILEELQNATSYNQMTQIADRFITSLAGNTRKEMHRLDTVSRWMICSGGKVSLDYLSGEACLSSKQFIRKFFERTGVNPKTYLRIIRFTRAIHTKNAYPNKDWLQIALECGYFDYQHLVKEYKEFTHHTPTDFHLLESNSPEQRLGLTDEIYKSRARSALLPE
ncbi:AraC family transcriptional regulator [Rhodocytophaga rosea]|uniref:AraC family transcriptional regulator n=1 Tax=Rhodocytophaga rosea TaxID=2704465 RepID=A0A6C0GRX6_9BACT|nr:helix-turn-helix domain-containing protein [Rhodocytophaga rosea]QHT70845.1 AraC family transcriptional regulator [Rhodocytophaga rosea]